MPIPSIRLNRLPQKRSGPIFAFNAIAMRSVAAVSVLLFRDTPSMKVREKGPEKARLGTLDPMNGTLSAGCFLFNLQESA